ncbi:MAG: DUF262 domain-containing protein [Spirochaetes bacterium]|nr:DUF262 domain-containing protein [Spirochaetota bacterium]
MSETNERKTRLMSVQQIIDETTKVNSWKLSVAQRAFEWDLQRVTNLVDSLLRGFPVGSILVMDSKDPYYDMDSRARFREKKESAIGNEYTHIIDGQQRCFAMRATFNGEGYHDRKTGDRLVLYVNISSLNESIRDFDEKRNQKYYLHWSARGDINVLSDDERKEEKFSARAPLAGWISLHELVRHIREGLPVDELRENARLPHDDAVSMDVTRGIIDSVTDALDAERIPVHFLNELHRDIEDIFHVFIRINTSALALGPVDVFFTGVKREWSDAEEHLESIVNSESIFDRKGAISCLARCAAKSLKKDPFDPVVLRLEHLRKDPSTQHYPLIEQMRQMAPYRGASNFIDAVLWTSRVVREHLYAASSQIHYNNLMAVVGWAFQYGLSLPLPDIFDERYYRPIIGFLFWTTIYGSRMYGRGSFDRGILDAAWNAGAKGDPFPYEQEAMQKLCFAYHYIMNEYRPFDPRPSSIYYTTKEDAHYANGHRIHGLTRSGGASLFLSVFQKLRHVPVDIDHLLAYNYGYNRFRSGRTVLPYANWLNLLGNFSAIDASANRVLQDRPPSIKFNRGDDTGQTYHNRDFVKTDHGVTEEEMNAFIEIERLLELRKQEEAGLLFQRIMADRTLRIWNAVLDVVGYPWFVEKGDQAGNEGDIT